MALDLDNIPAETRKQLVEVGRHFSSADTRAQADQTLSAHGVYGDKLLRWGFTPDDAARLQEACDALVAELVGAAAEAGKKVTNTAYVLAMRTGKSTRLRARTILAIARGALVVRHDAAEPLAAIDRVLLQAPSVGANAGALAAQLEALASVFQDPAVAGVTRDRGGPGIVDELGKSATALHALGEQASSERTFEAAERLDLLDGIIVALVREARRAARAAAQDQGEPELATAFELTKLYGPLGHDDGPASSRSFR